MIFGPSGCGKSTLLHIILGLENPTTGSVEILDKDLYREWDEDQRADFRKQSIGMVYQQSYWIKALNVVENVAFPLSLLGNDKKEALSKARDLLNLMGMIKWAEYFPTELSSGQQQKVSLARALINDPDILIADEPTGNLDYKSSQELIKILLRLNKETKKTFLMVTHDFEHIKNVKTKIAVEMFDGTLRKVYKENERDQLLKRLSVKGNIYDKDK